MRAPRLPAIIAVAIIATLASGCGSTSGPSRSAATSTPTSSPASAKLPVARVVAATSGADSSLDPSTEQPGATDEAATPTPESSTLAKDFKIDSDPQYTGGTIDHLTIIKCDGIAGTWGSPNGFSFTLDSSGHGTMTNDLGDTVTITLVLNTPSPYVEMDLPGVAIQKFAVTPGDFCNGDTPR